MGSIYWTTILINSTTKLIFFCHLINLPSDNLMLYNLTFLSQETNFYAFI